MALKESWATITGSFKNPSGNVCGTLQPHLDNAKRAVVPFPSLNVLQMQIATPASQQHNLTALSLRDVYIVDL